MVQKKVDTMNEIERPKKTSGLKGMLIRSRNRSEVVSEDQGA